jgi:hypothetical protein
MPPIAEQRAAESRLRSLYCEAEADHRRLAQTIADVRALTSPKGLADAKSRCYEGQYHLVRASEKCRVLQSDLDRLEPIVARLRAKAAARSAAEREAQDRLTAAAHERAVLETVMREPQGIPLPKPAVDETSEICAIAKEMEAAQREHRLAQEELAAVLRRQQREIAAMKDTRRRDVLFVTTHVIGYRRPVPPREPESDSDDAEADEGVPVLVAQDGVLLTQAAEENETAGQSGRAMRDESDLDEEEVTVIAIATQTEMPCERGISPSLSDGDSQARERPQVSPLELGSIDRQGKLSVILESGRSEGDQSSSFVLLTDIWTNTAIEGPIHVSVRAGE